MPALRQYKVFISHAWKYNEDYNRIVKFLNEAPNFIWENLSVPEHDPIKNSEQLTYELNAQMRPANVFLILAGMYVAHSDWIQYEINFARRIGRPIIGIRPWGAVNMPLAVQMGADEIVGWNTDTIVSAIRHHALADGQ
ncbi:MAG: TIR domain-containing protein [Phycisphaerales bacterium]